MHIHECRGGQIILRGASFVLLCIINKLKLTKLFGIVAIAPVEGLD